MFVGKISDLTNKGEGTGGGGEVGPKPPKFSKVLFLRWKMKNVVRIAFLAQ
jgi:hypothetical protein